jgi:RNase P/RNase MRP subunit POP5
MTAPQEERKRYICFKVHADVQRPLIEKILLDAIRNWIGEKDFAKSKVWFMQKLFDPTYKTGVIACNHDRYPDIREIVAKTKVQDLNVDVFFCRRNIKKSAKAHEGIQWNH